MTWDNLTFCFRRNSRSVSATKSTVENYWISPTSFGKTWAEIAPQKGPAGKSAQKFKDVSANASHILVLKDQNSKFIMSLNKYHRILRKLSKAGKILKVWFWLLGALDVISWCAFENINKAQTLITPCFGTFPYLESHCRSVKHSMQRCCS